jgi:hypothetical protein
LLGNGSSGLSRGSSGLGGSSLGGGSLDFNGLSNTVSVCLSLLDVLGEDLVVLDLVDLGLFVSGELVSLFDSLSSDSLFSDESLDLGGFVESLVTLLDFSSDYVLSHIVLLSQGEGLSDGRGSLGAESSGLVTIGNTFDFGITLLDDSESNNGEIGTADAASD